MNFWKYNAKKDSQSQPPIEIYSSIVKSIYSDQLTLIIGTGSTLLAAVILYLRSADLVHLVFAFALSLVGVKRILDGQNFRSKWREIKNSQLRLRQWELRYRTWGAAYVGLLGFWCFAVSARSSDDFILLMTISIILINLVGVTGRNFGSDIVVTSQLMWSGIPLILGSFLFGDVYHMLLGAFLFPFFVGIRIMSNRLRKILLSAVGSANENKIIADRFDATLNNISHGVAMIDSDGNFAVVNGVFKDLMEVPEVDLIGKSVASFADPTEFSQKYEPNVLDPKNKPNPFHEIEKCVQRSRSEKFKFEIADKRIIKAKYHPMDKGGVVLLEDISSRVASQKEIRELANFDSLTQLPNRRYFMEQLKKTFSQDSKLKTCSFYFIDLDNFKETNDSLGHAVGDKLLKTISLRLQSIVTSNVYFCRFGGDEFVVVLPDITDIGECQHFAETIIKEFSKPMLLDGHQIIVGATVGISINMDNSEDADQLLKHSDAALYRAKADGRGTFAFYTEELGADIRERRQIEQSLRRSIELGQISLNFQPLVDINTKNITTCEALARWVHPERGFVSPAQFIPIAEEIGFIGELGEYVLEQAAMQCLQWPEHVRVAVNVSSLQFRQSNIIEVVSSVLTRTGLDPNRLEIEVTESLMLENVEETSRTLREIAQMGVKISLDDFGTGFSNLSYLHTLPLDKVKIDRSFIINLVEDKKSQLVLEGVSQLGRSLGLKVVAEGVETIDQLELIQHVAKVDEIQGYLFSRPLPAEDIKTLMNNKLPSDSENITKLKLVSA